MLRENMYDLQQGEPSVFARESSASASSKPERTRQTPGVDYPHSSLCHICWEGKTYWGRSAALSQMMLCAGCPVAMHRKCLEERHIPIKFDHFGNKWFCTHHECEACGIKASAAGMSDQPRPRARSLYRIVLELDLTLHPAVRRGVAPLVLSARLCSTRHLFL